MSFEIRKVGVIGAGQMGKGIAQVCALAGMDVVLTDVSMDRIEAGIVDIDQHMRRAVEKGLINDGAREAALKHIKPAQSNAGFSDADLVIEAATESEEVKRKIFPTSRRA